MGQEIITQVQETQRVPNRINSGQNTPRHILIKLTKIKHKEQILKAAREKQQPRSEALFRFARPSGVPRGPATSTGSLASQRHPGKFAKVPVNIYKSDQLAVFLCFVKV